mgnify:CR=1 FL=1
MQQIKRKNIQDKAINSQKVDDSIALTSALESEAVSRIESDNNLQNQINAFPSPTQHSKNLLSSDIENQYVDLPAEVSEDGLIVWTDVGLVLSKEQDYSLSAVNSVTRITFINDMASGGARALSEGDSLFFFYLPLANIGSGGSGSVGPQGPAGADGASAYQVAVSDRKSTRLKSSHIPLSRMPSSA